MTSNPVIEFRNVRFSYNSLTVLTEVDFRVDELDLAFIVGPNGGGKTTLIKLVLGLLQPDHGEVRVFGEPPVRSRNRIGYTPQYMHYDPHFPITVRDIVLTGRAGERWGGFYSRSDKKYAMEMMSQIGISDLSNELFSSLSGGQRQRVLIARALASDPDLLLLDEPTANVDAEAGDKLFKIIRELNRKMTILMVSHDLGFVSNIVKKVICVNQKVVIHPTSEITNEAIRSLYEDDMRLIRHDMSCRAGNDSHE